uniref:Ig-like domain-containing protein n=1 Tax=Oryzias sinensis TaxID=183150 RepID=A0A8C8A1R0_9TELE
MINTIFNNLPIKVFYSFDLKDIEYISSMYYNKDEVIRFSSSLGKFVGYTEFGVKNAKRWNNDSSILSNWRAQKEAYCKHNIDNYYQNTLTKSEPGSSKAVFFNLFLSVTPSGGHHPAMLVCSIYNFYPKHIKVSWLRNHEEVSSDVTSTVEMEDGDWYYQIHSHLEYTPRSGEKISCKVEHVSLKDPIITDWSKYLSYLFVSNLSMFNLSVFHLFNPSIHSFICRALIKPEATKLLNIK